MIWDYLTVLGMDKEIRFSKEYAASEWTEFKWPYSFFIYVEDMVGTSAHKWLSLAFYPPKPPNSQVGFQRSGPLQPFKQMLETEQTSEKEELEATWTAWQY
jgi:hypothetical protein